MKPLHSSIEQLYAVFGRYTPQGMEHCDCGCIDEGDVRRLASKELRALAIEDMASYHGSALYTWGELEHYKHYLPRFLELQSQQRRFPLIDLYDIHAKLDYADWTRWPAEEVQAIRDYILADWVALVNGADPALVHERVANYSRFIELAELLQLWDPTASDAALRSFVHFFYHNGNALLDGGLRVGEKRYKEEFDALIRNGALREKLEAEFFRAESSDPEYAQLVSVVLQMLEQEEQTSGNKPG